VFVGLTFIVEVDCPVFQEKAPPAGEASAIKVTLDPEQIVLSFAVTELSFTVIETVGGAVKVTILLTGTLLQPLTL
jgi:hypothetical protein